MSYRKAMLQTIAMVLILSFGMSWAEYYGKKKCEMTHQVQTLK